jgi:serine/threonine protein kinase
MDLRRHLLGGPLPVQAALRIAAEVAEALQHAHQHGLIHRDVKPGNVLLGAGGSAYLADFGIAQSEEDLGQSADGRMTLAYAAPERFLPHAGPADARTDVWSLGVILYEMLTGERPFQGADAAALRQSIERGRPRAVRALNPDVPREVEAICLRCLAPAPGQRYATARELAGALRRALDRLSRGRFWLTLTVAGLTLALAAYNVYLLSRTVLPNRIYDRHDYDVTLDRGLDTLNRGNPRGACSHFEAALAMKESVVVHCLKADAHLKLNELDAALEHCERALQLDPDYPNAHYLRGTVLKRQGRRDEALAAFRRAVRCASPNSMKEIDQLENDHPPQADGR